MSIDYPQLIQHLDVIVDPTVDALLDSDEPNPLDPNYIPDPSSYGSEGPDSDPRLGWNYGRNPGRFVRVGGSGVTSNKRRTSRRTSRSPIAFVQSRSSGFTDGQAGQRSLSFSNDITAGDLVVAVIMANGSGNSVSSVSDTMGNTYAEAGSYSQGDALIDVWYATAIGSGPINFTYNDYTDTTPSIVTLLQYRGVSATTPSDGSAGHYNSGRALWTTSRVPVTRIGDLVIGAFAVPNIDYSGWLAYGRPANLGLAPSANYVQRELFAGENGFLPGYYQFMLVADHIGVNPSGESATCTFGYQTSGTALGVSFRSR